MEHSVYRHLKIFGAKGAPTSNEIREIEALLEAKLPDDFLEFLNLANGGYFDFCIDIDNDSLSFGDVYQTGRDSNGNYGHGTFIGEIRADRENIFQIPKKILPFARDGGGSCVFLDLTEEGDGRVVAFIQGLPEWTGKAQEDQFVELAPSFGEYVDLLYECPDRI